MAREPIYAERGLRVRNCRAADGEEEARPPPASSFLLPEVKMKRGKI